MTVSCYNHQQLQYKYSLINYGVDDDGGDEWSVERTTAMEGRPTAHHSFIEEDQRENREETTA